MGNVSISTASVPEGTCPPWIITRWPELVALLSANLQGTLNSFNYGSSTPVPADQDKPWLKLNSSGYPDGQYWVFKGGFWLKQHPLVPGIVTMWEGDITTIDTFDGGDTGAASLTTGPMWERVDGLNGRFPLGVGTQITSGTPINVADQGGEETHLLTVDELAAHFHIVNAVPDDTSGNGSQRLRGVSDPAAATATTQDAGGDMPHNNLPPFYGICFIRRTSRLYYRA